MVLFVPALLPTSLLLSAPLLFLAVAGVGEANPPLDAARLDVMPAALWGRAESVRTVLRTGLEALAPLLVMLAPLAGLLLLLLARRTYPRDVATGLASERAVATSATTHPGRASRAVDRTSQNAVLRRSI